MSARRSVWSSASLASGFAHRLFYHAIQLAGRPLAYAMLFFVVVFYTLRPDVRKRSRDYRLRRFGKRSFVQSLLDCFRLQLEFGKMLVDRAVMGITGDFEMTATAEDRERMTELAGMGRGLVLVTGHVGCWQLGMSFLDHIDAPKAVVMYRDVRDVDRHYFEFGESGGPSFDIIDPTSPMGGTLQMLEVLKRGGVLCVMGDRPFGSDRGTVGVEFLGGTVRMPIGAFKLASSLQVPVVVTFSCRTGSGCGRIWVSKVIDLPERLGREPEAYRPYAQMLADGLGEFVETYPWQFYNFFNMWDE
ncbi:lysophospholipid acyltransferase family protein [Desulfovibrio sp. Huiquan2017]|uniref:LpxL/LpxP family acyltransferase n=1 Tax=Desulfovibrio sp. Huiquan2017 TaxID=2816861 RepID=UPI001A90CD22